jgi:hypothetical protein
MPYVTEQERYVISHLTGAASIRRCSRYSDSQRTIYPRLCI